MEVENKNRQSPKSDANITKATFTGSNEEREVKKIEHALQEDSRYQNNKFVEVMRRVEDHGEKNRITEH